MRLSTAGMHRASIEGILENQARMAKTQMQIATGRKFQTAAEDPIGAVRGAVPPVRRGAPPARRHRLRRRAAQRGRRGRRGPVAPDLVGVERLG